MEADAALQPPGFDATERKPRPAEWFLALLPVDAVAAVLLDGPTLLLAASLFGAPPLLAAVRFRRTGEKPTGIPAALALGLLAFLTRLVVVEVFGGTGVL